jgi:class 3 adenylate cyclase/CheY-like chemotaxis protein
MKRDPTRVLIVDDEDEPIKLVRDNLLAAEPNWIYLTAKGRRAALELIVEHLQKREPITVLVTDLKMDDDNESGIKLINEAQEADRRLMAILYTTQRNLYRRLAASVKGAFDFVQRSGEESIRRIVEKTHLALRYGWLRRFPDRRFLEAVEKDARLLTPMKRNLTIAFWDIRGFSALCVQAAGDVDQIADFLVAYCDVAETTIYNHGGVLDKFIGDGVMALFGVLDQSEPGQTEAAVQAVRAAKEFDREFRRLMNHWRPKLNKKIPGIIAVHLGCGIHTKDAVVGNLGTEFRDQFTAVGPHVNFAQRLESMAAKKPPELKESDPEKAILVSATTAEYVRGEEDIKLAEFHIVTDVKNISGTYQVYYVVLDDSPS